MKKRNNKLVAVLTAFLLLFGIGVATAGPAAAGNCTTVGSVVLCGKVYNNSSINVKVSDNWCGYGCGNIAYVAPGHWSLFRDTDGYYIPAGKCNGTISGPRWVKLTDLETVRVSFYNC